MTATDAPPASTPVWGIGCYRDADGVPRSLALSGREFDREVDVATRRLRSWGFQADDIVLVVGGVAEAVQFAPFQRAARILGGISCTAERSPFDASRTAAFLTQFRLRAVVGLDADVLDGLEQLGDTAEVLRRCDHLVARADALARLRHLGLRPLALHVLGPAVAAECQGCSFPTRLLVDRSVYDEVVERIRDVATGVRIGDPFDSATQMGPVISADACGRILAVIERARTCSRLVAGGNRLDGDLAGGYFIEPTVFADVPGDSELARHEVFGPVLSVTPFSTEDEAVELANSTVYGLAAYVQSRDIGRVLRIVPRLKAGTVHVNGKSAMPPNAPFGGYGESGYGREGGRAGLDEFLQIKNVFVQSEA